MKLSICGFRLVSSLPATVVYLKIVPFAHFRHQFSEFSSLCTEQIVQKCRKGYIGECGGVEVDGMRCSKRFLSPYSSFLKGLPEVLTTGIDLIQILIPAVGTVLRTQCRQMNALIHSSIDVSKSPKSNKSNKLGLE